MSGWKVPTWVALVGMPLAIAAGWVFGKLLT